MQEEICSQCPFHFTAWKSNTQKDVYYCYLAFKPGRKSQTAVTNYKSVSTVKIAECHNLRKLWDATEQQPPKITVNADTIISLEKSANNKRQEKSANKCGGCRSFSENFPERHPDGWGLCTTPDTERPVVSVRRSTKACPRYAPKEAAE